MSTQGANPEQYAKRSTNDFSRRSLGVADIRNQDAGPCDEARRGGPGASYAYLKAIVVASN